MLKNLKKPICFIDLETTGLSTENDRIVEITICKVHPDGKQEVKTKRCNPEMEISVGASAIHGITDADVINEPTFKKFSKGFASFIGDSDLAGFRSNTFDFPLLYAEFKRAGINWEWQKSNFIDIYNILAHKEPRTLTGVYKYFCDKDLENSHSSEADILATVEIFSKQVEKYNLPLDNTDELALISNFGTKIVDISGKFVQNEAGELIINFGTNRGKKAKDEAGFLNWMLGKDFSEEVKEIAQKVLDELKPPVVETTEESAES